MSAPNSPHVSPKKGKYILAKVLMLDDVEHMFQVPHKALGYVLFDEVCRKLQLLECDYFDLEFEDHQGIACWIDHEKPILKQVSINNLYFKFLVKFYTPDPGLLEDEYTRYLFAMQIRRDIYTNNMQCQEHTWLLLASYIVQAEIGDYLEDEYLDHTYLNDMHLIPGQTEEQTIKLMEHHKELVGLSPAEADFNLLDTARKVDMYGIHVHTAKDHEGVLLNLSVAHMGVQVFQSMTRINTFSWAKIRKLSFKRKKFLIKLHPEGYGYYKDTVEFYFDSRNECKNFWKKCIEHHAFFRCSAVKRVPRNKTRIVSRGSSFRYSGRTQKQLIEYVRANYTKRPPFERSASMRTVSMRNAGATPNTSTLNSRDFSHSHHSAGGHNTSTSSGSHILDTASRDKLSISDQHQQFHKDQHPPRKETSADDLDKKTGLYNGRSPGMQHSQEINPQQFMLSDVNRNESEPVFGLNMKGKCLMDEHMTRSHEVENIPQTYQELPEHQQNQMRLQQIPDQQAWSPSREKPLRDNSMESHQVPTYTEVMHQKSPPNRRSPALAQSPSGSIHRDKPPPPPPIYEGDYPRRSHSQHSNHREQSPRHSTRSPPAPRSPASPSSPPPYIQQPSSPVGAQAVHAPPESQSTQIPPQIPHQGSSSITHHVHITPNHSTEAPQPSQHSPQPQSPSSSSPQPRVPSTHSYELPQHQTSMDSSVKGEDPYASPHKLRSDVTAPSSGARSITSGARSITSGTSIALTSSASITSSRTEDSGDDEGRRKRYPTDRAYYIAKELLMTERTYKKDLEVITVWFHDFMTKEDVLPLTLSNVLFCNINPIYEFHCSFLTEIEQRLALWEGRSSAYLSGEYQKIGDVFINTLRVLQLYMNYLGAHEEILIQLETLMKRSRQFEKLYKEFEAKLICYLPLNTFLLKPAQRLMHYRLLLERLVDHYPEGHVDLGDCKMVLKQMVDITEIHEEKVKRLENMQKLIELQRDLLGIDNLLQTNRTFIREGCLQKLSRKGFQQRMFFLLSDMLLYTSRAATPHLQFKVHGQLPLRGMIVEVTDPKLEVNDSFSIYAGNRCLVVAAGSAQEKDKWLTDLRQCIALAKERSEDKIQYPSLKSNSSSDNLEDSHEEPCPPASPDRKVQQRANTTIHVCWHRNTSVSITDHHLSVQNQLSGFLLRKFKNSNGWQKLWVVFTNFCLFFYKTVHEDFPLASLPLLGYTVSSPAESDAIHKDFVFKLQFKNHVYFFRAESDYTYKRWVEVIESATHSFSTTPLHSEAMSANNGQV